MRFEEKMCSKCANSVTNAKRTWRNLGGEMQKCAEPTSSHNACLLATNSSNMGGATLQLRVGGGNQKPQHEKNAKKRRHQENAEKAKNAPPQCPLSG